MLPPRASAQQSCRRCFRKVFQTVGASRSLPARAAVGDRRRPPRRDARFAAARGPAPRERARDDPPAPCARAGESGARGGSRATRGLEPSPRRNVATAPARASTSAASRAQKRGASVPRRRAPGARAAPPRAARGALDGGDEPDVLGLRARPRPERRGEGALGPSPSAVRTPSKLESSFADVDMAIESYGTRSTAPEDGQPDDGAPLPHRAVPHRGRHGRHLHRQEARARRGFEKEVVLGQLPCPSTRRDPSSAICFSARPRSRRPSTTRTSCTMPDLVESDESLFIVMEYVRGVDLQDHRPEGPPTTQGASRPPPRSTLCSTCSRASATRTPAATRAALRSASSTATFRRPTTCARRRAR